MRTINQIPDGFHTRAALTPNGWLSAVTVIKETSPHRAIRAVACRNGRLSVQELSRADRIAGAGVTGGKKPAIAWCERQDKIWRLMLWQGGKDSHVLTEQPAQLSNPSCAHQGPLLLVACESATGSADTVAVHDGTGKKLFSVPGRRPLLTAGPGKKSYLLVERVESPDQVSLYLYELSAKKLGKKIHLPQIDAYDFNAHMICDAETGTLYIVHEAARSWGTDNRMGRHREICLWTFKPGDREVQPAPGTGNAVISLAKEGHWNLSYHNMPTVFPHVLIVGGEPAVAYRKIHFGGHRSFGWHTHLTRFDGESWSTPVQISRHVGLGDAAYEVLGKDRGILAFLPSCDVRPSLTFQEMTALPPVPPDSAQRKARNFRLEIVSLRRGESVMPESYPPEYKGSYVIPPMRRDVCPEPPAVGKAAGELHLVWGDLHAHSAYSRCMAPDDGFPLDNLRFQRDVLGCQVLSLVEHTKLMGMPEFVHVYDTLEQEAGRRCIPLYGCEPGLQPAHHINFYAADREIFDHLHEVITSMTGKPHESVLFSAIKNTLPKGAVVVVRHGHGMASGDFGTKGPRVTELYDPELELAMEAMQLRGNMMLEDSPKVVSGPLFPNNFLNAGARISLLGGTDHSNPACPNHFCLTGFWVKEFTAQAVFDAMKTHKTIACSNGKVAIYAELNGNPMGEEVEVSGEVRITAHLSSGTPIRRVCLICDGKNLGWQEVGKAQARVELTDKPQPGYHWYVATAQADSTVARVPVTAHASPFFVTVR